MKKIFYVEFTKESCLNNPQKLFLTAMKIRTLTSYFKYLLTGGVTSVSFERFDIHNYLYCQGYIRENP
jgi:hypothetical protein